MSEYTKHLTPRPELRERIIETAVKAFAAQGIKSITMDDIATSLGIPSVLCMRCFLIRRPCWKSVS